MTDLIQRELDLNAPPAAVWAALTDPDWLETWLADAVSLELWPGGEAQFTTGDTTREGWVEEVSAPQEGGRDGRFAFWWAEAGEPASRVELVVTEIDGGTRVRVVESRPLDVLDLVGVPMPGHGGRRYGPALVAG